MTGRGIGPERNGACRKGAAKSSHNPLRFRDPVTPGRSLPDQNNPGRRSGMASARAIETRRSGLRRPRRTLHPRGEALRFAGAQNKKGIRTMRKHLSLAAAAAMLVSMPLAAEAFPIAPAQSGTAPVTLVSGGCGPGFHRGPLGGCRPNGGMIVGRPVTCRIVGLIPHRVCRVW